MAIPSAKDYVFHWENDYWKCMLTAARMREDKRYDMARRQIEYAAYYRALIENTKRKQAAA